MAVQRYVGVDFGTSTSVIRVKRYKDGKPVEPRLDTKSVVFDAAGSVLVPSLIRTIGDNKPYYGYEAALGKKNSTLYQSFKIDLESDEEEKITLARKLTSDFLAYMGKQYNFQSEGGHFGEPNDEEHTIISYPVKWSEETKKFMLDAAKKAGFKNVEGMDEAHAAIHAVTMQNENYLKNKHYLIDGTPVNILLIDMGAGTTDLIVCRYTPGSSPKNEILCTWPKNGGLTFGGREVDEILRNYIKSMMSEEDADVILRKVGIDQFKAWKEMSVSPALTRNETVTEFSALDNILDILEIDIDDYSLDRAKFESFAKDYLEQFSRLINDCVNASGLNGGDIDLVITTGGHSQWYFVNDIIKSSVSLTKIKADSGRIVSVPRPHETVALGLVYSPISPQVEKPPRKKPEKMPEENNESEEQAVNDVDLVNNATEDEIAEVAMAELPNMPASKAYTLAKNSYKEGNYENAYKYFLTAALADNMYAQYRLSQLYATGLGCKKSQERAQTWLERSAKSGYSEAIRKLENNSYSGNTEKKTSESGISHTSNTLNVSVKYRKACAILREKDYGEAFDRFLYAAKENDAAAQYKLALMYLLNIAPREAYDDSTKKVFLRMFGQVAFDTRFETTIDDINISYAAIINRNKAACNLLERSSELGCEEAETLLQKNKGNFIKTGCRDSAFQMEISNFMNYDYDVLQFKKTCIPTNNMSVFRSRLGIPKEDKIYLLTDTSWFKRGKNGLAICSSGIYCNPFSFTAPVISWEDIILKTIDQRLDSYDNKHVFVGDREFYYPSNVDKWWTRLMHLQEVLRKTNYGEWLIKLEQELLAD